jgi:hypothetical protein
MQLMIVSIVAGVLADSYDRRFVMLASQVPMLGLSTILRSSPVSISLRRESFLLLPSPSARVRH